MALGLLCLRCTYVCVLQRISFCAAGSFSNSIGLQFVTYTLYLYIRVLLRPMAAGKNHNYLVLVQAFQAFTQFWLKCKIQVFRVKNLLSLKTLSFWIVGVNYGSKLWIAFKKFSRKHLSQALKVAAFGPLISKKKYGHLNVNFNLRRKNAIFVAETPSWKTFNDVRIYCTSMHTSEGFLCRQ